MLFKDLFQNPAFAPFYDERIIVETVRDRKLTRSQVTACVMTDSTGEPLTDECLDSQVETVSVILPYRCELLKTIRRGDTIKTLTGKTYAVQEVVEDYAMGKLIKCRSK